VLFPQHALQAPPCDCMTCCNVSMGWVNSRVCSEMPARSRAFLLNTSSDSVHSTPRMDCSTSTRLCGLTWCLLRPVDEPLALQTNERKASSSSADTGAHSSSRMSSNFFCLFDRVSFAARCNSVSQWRRRRLRLQGNVRERALRRTTSRGTGGYITARGNEKAGGRERNLRVKRDSG